MFEHPAGVGEAAVGEADDRKQWGAEGEGASLVAMLQEKTLQTATYAVQKGATQSKLVLREGEGGREGGRESMFTGTFFPCARWGRRD